VVLRDLRDKYVRMRILRERHGRARADPAWVEPDPRPEMTRLAKEFPGALREIDRLPAHVIEERIRDLDTAMQPDAAPLPWMTAQLAFHAQARAVLSAKKWLRGRKTIDAATRAAFVAAHPDLAAIDLAAVAAPPGGRVMNVVYTNVAAELGIDIEAARRLVLPARSGRGLAG